ncbi:hypothetical protein DCAR_0518764 [Daucus carota subsp. sativus]|uniref:Uncharacterized protein n=1 Tax=Daucus carota subsp. sativus TaxID=79200 RepID=A0A164XGX7_DAUCS|nr:hypothetical protein DCAR_0518764 [Daucus carota subsp. sativus]
MGCRKNKHKVVPSNALSGSTISAFDDVSFEDPDFLYIQSLAEAGIVLSKLSVDDSSWQKGAKIFPDRWDTPIHVDAPSGGFIAPFFFTWNCNGTSAFLHNFAVVHLSCQLLCHLTWECVKLLEHLLDICNQAFSQSS